MTAVKLSFSISGDLIKGCVGNSQYPFGLDRPNYRTDDSIKTGRCPKILEEYFADVVEEQFGIARDRLAPLGSSSPFLLARFGCVGLHTDESFPRYCIVLPLIGSGTLRLAPGAKRVDSYLINKNMGVLFDNHIPHDFILSSRSFVVAALISVQDPTKREWERLRRGK
jgi:hypothetical protein